MDNLGGVLTTPAEGFENRGFTLKAREMFSCPRCASDIQKRNNPSHFNLCLRRTRDGKYHDLNLIVFEKPCFQNVFCPHKNAKPAFSNSFGLKSVLEKLHFRDGLVWTVGLTGEIKLRLQIPLASCGQGLIAGINNTLFATILLTRIKILQITGTNADN